MKNKHLLSSFSTTILFSLIVFTGIFSCSDDSTTSSPTLTIEGTLNLPFEANGKTWGVLIDNDLDGGNGYIKIEMGTCGAEMNISYSIDDVPKGIYYIYAFIFIVSDGSQGPQNGDLVGVYGGQYPDNRPTSPNADISSSNQIFNIDLYVMQEELSQDEIVAHWTFDEMSGNTLSDKSIYNNQGTIVNAQWVSGNVGGALQFQDECYVNIPYSSSLQPTGNITLEAIIKFTTFSQNQGIFSTNEYGGYGLWVFDTLPNIFIQIDSEYQTASASSSELNLNQWYHIAGVYNGSELKFYINGDLKESIDANGPITYTYHNALKIGSDASSTDEPDAQFFQGIIDEIRITRIALQPEQFLSF